jgi:hypothetical protein
VTREKTRRLAIEMAENGLEEMRRSIERSREALASRAEMRHVLERRDVLDLVLELLHAAAPSEAEGRP